MLDVIFKFGRNMKNWGKSSHIHKHFFSNWSHVKCVSVKWMTVCIVMWCHQSISLVTTRFYHEFKINQNSYLFSNFKKCPKKGFVAIRQHRAVEG